MSLNDRLRPHPAFRDPRLFPGFVHELWPLCNGKPAPFAGQLDVHEQRCLEFLAAYYQLNLLTHGIHQVERAGGSHALLQTARAILSQALLVLEELEDRYAPIGLYGEPTTVDGIHRNVDFVRPGLNLRDGTAASACAHVGVPGLDEFPFIELSGPARIVRWPHGKVDL